MNNTDWVVVGLGAAAIAWVNWYFFLTADPRPASTAEHGHDGAHHH